VHKVIITPNPQYDPIGVRLTLQQIGVGPMIQDATTIRCLMSDDQISRFRNGRGAAHKLEVVPDASAPLKIEPELEPIPMGTSEDEPGETDPSTVEPPEFPKTFGKKGSPRVIVNNADAEREAIAAGYKHVDPDPLKTGGDAA